MQEVFIVGAVRSAIGTFGGSLKGQTPAALGALVARELGFDPEKVNPNGSGISLGHPVGATGAINTVKLACELRRTGKRYGLVTMCIGGGQGIAAILERA